MNVVEPLELASAVGLKVESLGGRYIHETQRHYNMRLKLYTSIWQNLFCVKMYIRSDNNITKHMYIYKIRLLRTKAEAREFMSFLGMNLQL